jgi:hypothetical protein
MRCAGVCPGHSRIRGGYRVAALAATLASALLAPVAAGAETPAAPGASSAPAAPPATGSAPAAGAIRLALRRVGGSPPFALVGRGIVVRGVVTPYVAGQTVAVSFYLDGRKVATSTASVLALGSGEGELHVDFKSHYAGLLRVRVAHSATAQQAAFSGVAPALR